MMKHPSDFSRCVFHRVGSVAASYIDYDDCGCGRSYGEYLEWKETQPKRNSWTWERCSRCGSEIQHKNGKQVTHLDHAVGCIERDIRRNSR